MIPLFRKARRAPLQPFIYSFFTSLNLFSSKFMPTSHSLSSHKSLGFSCARPSNSSSSEDPEREREQPDLLVYSDRTFQSASLCMRDLQRASLEKSSEGLIMYSRCPLGTVGKCTWGWIYWPELLAHESHEKWNGHFSCHFNEAIGLPCLKYELNASYLAAAWLI